MAITRLTVSGNMAITNSITDSQTLSSLSNRFMICLVWGNNGTIGVPTFNGVSMTLLYSANNQSGQPMAYYYLLNPSSGTNNIIVTKTGSSYMGYWMNAYSGVNQTTPIHSSTAFTNSPGSNNTYSNFAITTTIPTWITVLLQINNTSGTRNYTATANYTHIGGTGILAASSELLSADSNSLVSANTFTGTYSYPALSVLWSSVQLALTPAADVNNTGAGMMAMLAF